MREIRPNAPRLSRTLAALAIAGALGVSAGCGADEAPDEGEVQQQVDDAQQQVDDAQEQAESATDEAREQVESAADDAQEQAESATDELQGEQSGE